MAVIGFVAAFVIMVIVPKWRHWAHDKIRTPLSQIGEALETVKNPRTALTAPWSSSGV